MQQCPWETLNKSMLPVRLSTRQPSVMECSISMAHLPVAAAALQGFPHPG
jgi:hypothetical protein